MKKLFLLFLAFVFVAVGVDAQEKETLKEKDDLNKLDEGWSVGSGFGLNLDQLLVINPRAGAGEDRIGFGGLGNVFATYKDGRFVWDNIGNLSLAFQRIGFSRQGQPFNKAIDDLFLATKPGYAITADEKWYAALEVAFQSQLLKTYENNFLKSYPISTGTDSLGTELFRDANLISQFLSPAVLTISPGIDWKPNENFSLFVSPAAVRMLIVANDDLAQGFTLIDGNYVSNLGNPVTVDANGNLTDYKNIRLGVGASARANYKNTFLNDKIAFNSMLYVFYDYLGKKNSPVNHPVMDWTTATTFNIYKGLGLTLSTALNYDHNKPVTPYNRQTKMSEQSRRGFMFTESIAVTYSRVFGAKKKLEE